MLDGHDAAPREFSEQKVPSGGAMMKILAMVFILAGGAAAQQLFTAETQKKSARGGINPDRELPGGRGAAGDCDAESAS
jgi:hypothetical protein